ncbi:MAG TPA: cytidylate kinase-like family protein [Candidatus Binataceae bacterium]|nr:cytidylate kinase-like family protein [Candidatus Binataceae bacterium]
MAVIAINQQLGSAGIQVGEAAAAKLGCRFVTGDQLIAATAERFDVSADQMRIFDIHTPHFWERGKSETPRYLAFFRAVLLKELCGAPAVVVGRSVAFMLPQSPCTLRARVIAPLQSRVARVMAEEQLTQSAAEKKTLHYDGEVKARIQSLYNLDIDDSANYDLVLKNAQHPISVIADTIAAAAAAIDAAGDTAAPRRLHDAAIAAQVHAALFAHPKIQDAQIVVGCSEGRVNISGPGLVPPWDELVIAVARSVEGVAAVEVGAEAAVIPDPPG